MNSPTTHTYSCPLPCTSSPSLLPTPPDPTTQPQSAILAAIQICLGAGARRTHRATNLKELVRKEAGSNCNGAKVRVTVLNRGDDGYQHDVYGDSITIERSIFLRGGYNGYKLLDENGVEKSRNKKDLDAMLDQLNIQVENPVAVLDQEEAKKFLCGKPEDKYNFFTKATELERMDRAYASLSDNIADMAEAAVRIKETLAPKEQTVKALKHEYEQFKELDKLEAEVGELRVTAMWAKRNEMKAKADEAQEVSMGVFFFGSLPIPVPFLIWQKLSISSCSSFHFLPFTLIHTFTFADSRAI